MLKFHLVNGEIKFLVYSVKLSLREDHNMTRDFYSKEGKDAFISKMKEQHERMETTRSARYPEYEPIKWSSELYTLIKHDTPDQELLDSIQGRKFESKADAQAFIEGVYEEPLTVELLAEVVADLIGGAL